MITALPGLSFYLLCETPSEMGPIVSGKTLLSFTSFKKVDKNNRDRVVATESV